jgi:hypothetical protein
MEEMDMGEAFRMMTEHKKERRKSNTEKSTKLLIDAGVDFVSKNGGSHLIIDSINGRVNFWPSTGLWTVNNSKKEGRGVFGLIKFVKGDL